MQHGCSVTYDRWSTPLGWMYWVYGPWNSEEIELTLLKSSKIPVESFFEFSEHGRTRGLIPWSWLNTEQTKICVAISSVNQLLTDGTVQLDMETVEASSLNSFKNRLAKLRVERMGFFMDFCRWALWLDQVLHLVQPHQVYEYDQVYGMLPNSYDSVTVIKPLSVCAKYPNLALHVVC